MRLDKLLSHLGYGTRSEIKKIMKNGVVTVDGKVVKDSAQHVDPFKQQVIINDKEIFYREHIYLMLNKPPGVISATEDHVEKTVIDLLPEQYQAFKPFPVGRLDKDTVGLIIITNDGKLSHELLSPKKHVSKRYYAEVSGFVDEEDIRHFDQGIELEDGYLTLPAQLVVLESDQREDLTKVEVTIIEGKFHQIKRMFQARGKRVQFLKRVAMGRLSLDETLQQGEVRELTEAELNLLRSGGNS